MHCAGIQDRDGGILLLATMKGLFPLLDKLFADSAYQGPIFANGLANHSARILTRGEPLVSNPKLRGGARNGNGTRPADLGP